MKIQVPGGALIVFEGIDGAGKTTQVAALHALLEQLGFGVVRTKEPTRGKWGQIIRASSFEGRLAPEEELNAFLMDRREHIEALIGPSLKAGKVVLVDRYYFSTMAYQSLRGFDVDDIRRRNEAFAPKPDLLVILEMDADIGLSRVRSRDGQENHFERRDDLVEYAKVFAKMDFPYLLRLDGRRAADALTHQITEAVLDGPLRASLCSQDDPANCASGCVQSDACAWEQVRRAYDAMTR